MTIPASGNWLNEFEVAAFTAGRNARLAGNALPGDPNVFWTTEGYLEAGAGWPMPALYPDSPPPLGQKLAQISADDFAAYQRGYSTYPAALLVTRPFWERQGYIDRKASLAPQPLVIGQPPPAFMVPVAGAPPPAPPGSYSANYVTAGDVTDYTSGRQVALAGRRLVDAGGGFWSREGYLEGQAGWSAAVMTAQGAPPAGAKLAPLSSDDVLAYKTGYLFYPTPIDSSRGFWFRQGYYDRQNGLPSQPVAVGQPPPPFGAPPVYPTPYPLPPPPGGVRYLELVATEWSMPIPYNLAVKLSPETGSALSWLIGAGLGFEILGDGPGDNRRGYKLSGPNGPIAQVVRRLIAMGELYPNPSDYGLPAWFGARAVALQNGRVVATLRLISARELQNLGLLEQVNQLGSLTLS